MNLLKKVDLATGTWLAKKFGVLMPRFNGGMNLEHAASIMEKATNLGIYAGGTHLGSPLNVKTSLEARHFEAIDPSLGVEFLKEHNCVTHPELWREIKKNRRVIKDKVITTAYVNFLALMHQTDATTIGDFKYHDSGIGTGAEAVGDVGLGTPWGGARDVGTQVASNNTYTSVATTTYNATKAITEHGLFNASTGVTLMDRTVFAAINVVDTNQIQWTFVATYTAGG